MYAIIESGGKQHRVQVGEVVRVETLTGEPGGPIVFDRVLLLGGDHLRVGAPWIEGASVRGTVVGQGRGPKIVTYIFKRRQNSNRKHRGHRQNYTAVKIDAIEG